MKSTLYIEHLGQQLDDKTLISKVKELWVESGSKLKDIKTINLYVKPEENTVYYVVNDTFKGNYPMI